MLSTGIFDGSAASASEAVVRPVDCLVQSSPVESGLDVSSPSVTDDDVALKLHIVDDFGNLKRKMNYEELAVSADENHSHGAISSDSLESLRNGFIVNDSQNLYSLQQTNGSEAALLQDWNFVNIPATSWQSDTSPTREKNGLASFENVEELIDLFAKASETEEGLEREEPLFSLLDVYCPIENQEASLFPPLVSFSSSAVIESSGNNCSSFMDYSENGITSSYAVCCDNNLPGYFSNETSSTAYNFGDLLASDDQTHASCSAAEPSIQQNEYTLGIDGACGSLPELGCGKYARIKSRSPRKRGRPRKKRKTVSSETEVFSVSEMQNNSSSFDRLSEIETEELPRCSLSPKAFEEVQLAASGNGYVSEFAKFIHSIFKNDVEASESLPGGASHSVSRTSEFQSNERIESQPKRNCVRLKSKEDSRNSSVNLSVATMQTSSKRFIQKPSCACCLGKDSNKRNVNNSRKRQDYPAKQGRVDDAVKSTQHNTQYMVAVDPYTTCQEQLTNLQWKLFRLLHILFPFLTDWKYIRPYSPSLEVLIDQVTDSLKGSPHKNKSRVRQPCCPVVTLCRFPALCLDSLQRKATVLINLLIPSLRIGDDEHDQLEMIIDELISSNADAGYSNQL